MACIEVSAVEAEKSGQMAKRVHLVTEPGDGAWRRTGLGPAETPLRRPARQQGPGAAVPRESRRAAEALDRGPAAFARTSLTILSKTASLQ